MDIISGEKESGVNPTVIAQEEEGGKMAEYIEREALIDEINIAPVSMSICMNVDECKGRIYERERLVRIINAAPAADVVPVVRCKDCRHSAIDLMGLLYCKCVAHYNQVSDDFYCADGERKDGDGE